MAFSTDCESTNGCCAIDDYLQIKVFEERMYRHIVTSRTYIHG